MTSAITTLVERVDRWLTTPEPHAAGRVGLFRILYSLFYLWYLSEHHAASLVGLREAHRYRIVLVRLFPTDVPAWLLLGLESVLVGSLVLLLLGLGVRWTTAAVLASGTLLEAFFTCADIEHGTVLLVVWIPLFMSLAGRWGDTYSLDALLRRRRGEAAIAAECDAWQYHLPARAILVVLSVLFANAAVLKVQGSWIEQPEFFANTLLGKNIDAAVYGFAINPLAPAIARNALLHSAMQYGTIAFEGLYFLVLFGSRPRNLVLSFALLFHSVCAIWMSVTFTPILVVYALYVDLYAPLRRIGLQRLAWMDAISAKSLRASAIVLALVCATLWNTPFSARPLLNLGGLVDWRTIWYPILPISLAWFAISLVRLSITRPTARS